VIFKRVILIILVFISSGTAQVPMNHQVNNFFTDFGTVESNCIIPKNDSLKINFADTLKIFPVQKNTIKWNKQRIIGIGVMVAFGLLSYHFHCEAEESYNAYLRSGSYSEMDRLFAEAKRYDRYTGFSYIGVEIGFLITVFSFDKHLP